MKRLSNLSNSEINFPLKSITQFGVEPKIFENNENFTNSMKNSINLELNIEKIEEDEEKSKEDLISKIIQNPINDSQVINDNIKSEVKRKNFVLLNESSSKFFNGIQEFYDKIVDKKINEETLSSDTVEDENYKENMIKGKNAENLNNKINYYLNKNKIKKVIKNNIIPGSLRLKIN